MDAKDLRTESALGDRNNDGSKYSQSGGIALHCDRNKSYQDIGSNSLAKVDVPSARPCAVIGPDRVVPPSGPNEAYLKKGPAEPWPCMDNTYHTRRPPEYPHKLSNFQNPTRNISPRQTYQENMQRIMVPPSYNSVKINDDTNYVQLSDRSNALPKNIKINMPPEAKFCDVPYTVYPNNNEQKNVRNAEMCIPNVNPSLTRTAPHGWPPGSVNIRPTRTYGAPELYQYQEYPSCAGPRPVVPRANRTVPEESGYVYADPFYHQEGNIRFKPYPQVKERFSQQRYEYIANYPNSFHPPPAFPTHKYELQKTVPPHPYPPYPPIKYLDRAPEPVMEGYQRNQQGTYNIPYRNQIIHQNYGPVLGNCPQNKIHSYPPDAHIKTLGPNKMPFDNAKAYIEYEHGRPKICPPQDSYFVNEMGRVHPMKSQVIMPNYPTLNMHNIPTNPYYKKDNQPIKNYEYLQTHYRGMEPNMNIHNPMIRHPPVFSPNTSAISPTDSSTSNDTSQTLGTSQEDCGYVSQSSTASVRSIDSGMNRIPTDCLRKYYDSRYGPIIRTAPMMSKSELSSNNHSKEKKNLDVRQFLQMWNEGDEETEDNHSKEIMMQSGPKSENNFIKAHEVISQPSQEQLYVLGLVNVPSEELGKYEHIQKVSKLPENIKGYNHIELLNQFEEAIESSNMTNYKTSTPKDFQMSSKIVPTKPITGVAPPRPLSPLDVEAKISQSVIHKEVGCNFEIKPCSPKMLNVEVATPVQNILAERAIEKVANPVMLKSPRLNGIDENMDCNIMKRKEHRVSINNDPVRVPSCKMVNTQFSHNSSIDPMKNSYSLQDLESNSGLCLASLPRLDNDIELNFPEVNQQFINANKGDSSATLSLKDLPSLELLDQSDIQTKDKLNDINSSDLVNDVLKSPCIIDSEKEFSKLSKYRKTKTHVSDPKENHAHVMSAINAARTDSVIIKNPENTKNYEEKNTSSPICSNKPVGDTQQAPINLTSQGNIAEDTNRSDVSMTHNASQDKENDASIEIAIDFSLNKSSSNENVTETNDTKEGQILTHNTTEENDLSKLASFPADNQDIQPFINNNKLYEKAIPIKSLKDDTLSLKENPPLEEIFTKSESLLSVSAVKEIKNDNDEMVSVTTTNDFSNVNNHSELPIEFATPATEFLQADGANSSYLMDIDKNNDVVETESHKSSNSLMEDDFKNDYNSEREDISNDVEPNVEAVNDSCSEVRNTNKIEDFQLNDAAKDTKQTIDASVVKDRQNKHSNTFDVVNKENIKQKADFHFDLGAPNKDQIKTSDEDELNLPYTEPRDSNDLKCNAAQQHSNYSSSSPNSIVLLSPKDDLLELIRENTESNLKLLPGNDNTIDSKGYDELEITPTDTQLIITDTPNFLAETPHLPVSNFELPSPNTVAANETTEDSLKGITATSLLGEVSDKLIDLSSINETYSKDMSAKDDPAILKTLVERRDMRVNLGIRYLSYGSKEMYSPWIQKLVLFCEGKSSYLGSDDGKNSNNCQMETEVEQIVQSSHIEKIEEKGNLTESKNNDKKTFVDISMCDAKHLNDSSCNEELKINIANTEEDCKITADDSFHSSFILHDQKDVKTTPSDAHGYKSNGVDNSTNSSIVNNTENNIDELNIRPNFEKVERCLSPESDAHWDSLSNGSDKTQEECKQFSDCNEKNPEQWDNESNCSEDVSKQPEQPSIQNNVVSIQSDNETEIKGAISEQRKRDPNCYDKVSKHLDDQSNQNEITPNNWDYNKDIPQQLDKLFNDSENVCSAEQWDKDSNYSDDLVDRWDKQSNCGNDVSERWDKQSNSSGTLEKCDKQLNYNDNMSDQYDEHPKVDNAVLDQTSCSDEIPEKNDTLVNYNTTNEYSSISKEGCRDDVSQECSKESNFNDALLDKDIDRYEIPNHCYKEPIIDKEILPKLDKQPNCNITVEETSISVEDCSDVLHDDVERSKVDDVLLDTQNMCDEESNSTEIITKLERQPVLHSISEVNSSTIAENYEGPCKKFQTEEHIFNKKRQPLKRSLSDSALNFYSDSNDNTQQENEENVQFLWPFKRRKIIHNDILAQDLCNIIQNNRRNSISAIYNEENVSFCILIDNDCIITEEENDDQEKICYTEVSEDCLADIETECTKDIENIETMNEILSDLPDPQQEDVCEYSDSFIMQSDNEKLEESWVEDVACVETVISDDIDEDIDISGPMSPKDNMLSDNDESGVFSSSEHTDKVKYIYGGKMCNDDAHFVDTLYNTPQMDVNKTLVQRENLISGEYYDNDSLEKILSESNEQDLSPYEPEYKERVYSPGFVDVKETVEEEENKVENIYKPLHNTVNALDIVDTAIEKIHQEHVKLCELFDETQEDTVHSYESSVDNIFTYKENDENTNYTSSSPEVSSTTSEEKKSAILLKITNYQGSRISQINDVNRDSKRSSCKFTEDKDYVQSQSNFSKHRPLLTKAAQKYIPPLKESIRDLKVKLSLPQHSLIKLKQLKNSKDEPKLCKQNVSVPRTSKKPKPKFEDVLKSIDEIQIKMHKEKTKKTKKAIPKVVIKKNENGSHYASTSNKDDFNPDLTGRKWQPWVFIEKNHFIDKMATKKKTKAIYSHRKRTYVLAEKFQKYKSVNSGKFVISPPISDCPSAGLKYTIRLKHNY